MCAQLLDVFLSRTFFYKDLKYLSLCKHTDVGGCFRRMIIIAVCEDGAVEEGQVIADWMVQLHLGEINAKQKDQ